MRSLFAIFSCLASSVGFAQLVSIDRIETERQYVRVQYDLVDKPSPRDQLVFDIFYRHLQMRLSEGQLAHKEHGEYFAIEKNIGGFDLLFAVPEAGWRAYWERYRNGARALLSDQEGFAMARESVEDSRASLQDPERAEAFLPLASFGLLGSSKVPSWEEYRKIVGPWIDRAPVGVYGVGPSQGLGIRVAQKWQRPFWDLGDAPDFNLDARGPRAELGMFARWLGHESVAIEYLMVLALVDTQFSPLMRLRYVDKLIYGIRPSFFVERRSVVLRANFDRKVSGQVLRSWRGALGAAAKNAPSSEGFGALLRTARQSLWQLQERPIDKGRFLLAWQVDLAKLEGDLSRLSYREFVVAWKSFFASLRYRLFVWGGDSER